VRKERRLFAGIFLLSFSVLIFEITLIRWLSVVVASNLAFLGITFALFGVAFGGVIVYGIPEHFTLEKFNKQLSWYSLSYGVVLSVFIIVFARLNFSAGGVILVAMYLLPAIPFTLANICLSLLFKFRSDLVGRLYFLDLAGASVGVLAAIVLLNLLRAANLFFIAGVLGLMAACCFGYGQRKFLISSLILAFAVLGLTAINQTYDLVDVIYSRHGKEANNIFTKWNAFSRISVQREDEPRMMLSLPSGTRVIPMPEQRGIEIDGDAYTPVLRFNGDLSTMAFLKRDLSSLGFSLATKGEVLIVGPGGGRDVLMALLYGHHVRGVDINPIIIDDLMKDQLRAFSGNLYFHPRANITVSEGRSFIHRNDYKYSLIDIPLVDTFAATSAGNLVLVENNLYTVEAFEDYLQDLSDDGILTISRWEFDGMRLVTLFLEASRRFGIRNPEKHVVVVSNGIQDPTMTLNNYLFKKTEFSQQEITAIKNFSAANNFTATYMPGEQSDSDYYRFLYAQDKKSFIANYWKNIKPVYDDNPFFFFVSPLSGLFHPFSGGYDGGLGNAFIITAALSLLIILVPRTFSPTVSTIKTSREALFYLSYFACLGASFILIEMSLIQKFILFLEKPIYSFSVIIASILLFAGIGSYLSRYIDSLHLINYFRIIGGIVIILVVFVFLLRPVINLTIGFAIELKVLIAVIINAPLSLLMGTLLPLAMTRLSKTGRDVLIPWCWAVNGAVSVLGSVAAVVLAIIFGFNAVLVIGGTIYLLSLAFISAISKPQTRRAAR
jgi:spermidine synthase